MVSAVEFRAGNRAVVHHTIMFLDANGAARKLDGQDGQPGYRSYGGAGVKPTGGLGAWVPGTIPRHLPDGMAKYVKAGSDLVLQVHYHPSGKPETDQSSIGIYFAKQPTKQIVTGIAVTQPLLRLPAGKAHCDVRTRCEPLPVDVNVLGISPHMHDLGREFKVTARLPGGERSAADLDQGLGLQLARHLPVRQAGATSQGNGDLPACRVRQLGRQSQEPPQSAARSHLGRTVDRRNVPLRRAGVHRRSGRPGRNFEDGRL